MNILLEYRKRVHKVDWIILNTKNQASINRFSFWIEILKLAFIDRGLLEFDLLTTEM